MRGIFHFAQMKNVCVSHSSEWMERHRKEAENIPVASARQANTFGHRSVDQLKPNPSQSFPDTTHLCKMHSAQLHSTKPRLSENIFSLNLLNKLSPFIIHLSNSPAFTPWQLGWAPAVHEPECRIAGEKTRLRDRSVAVQAKRQNTNSKLSTEINESSGPWQRMMKNQRAGS